MASSEATSTEVRQCDYEREGPQIGRWVVAWRKQCKRKVRVPVDATRVRCWQHR